MAEWKYLCTDVFKNRYIIAANWVKDCPELLEIGGYKTPITDFVDKTKHTKIYVIDPRLEETQHNDPNIHHWADYFPCPRIDVTPGNYALIAIGMDIVLGPEDRLLLYDYIDKARKVVIEFPRDYNPSEEQFNLIMANTEKRIQQEMTLDFSKNDFNYLVDSTPVFPYRQMFLLQ